VTASPAPGAYDPYDVQPTIWQRHADYVGAVAVFFLTVILTVVMFPPYHAPEFAYAFASPALFWAYRRPSLKLFAWTLFAAQAVAWTIILSWLHHVTWLGLFLLGPFVGAWVGLWYLAGWWVMPRLVGRPTLVRLAAQIGLAGLWVVCEWTRSWFLGGFDWLPLAASQWERNSILQIAAYTGAGGISFVLIMMNVGFAAYANRLLCEGRVGLGKRSQEFFFALFLCLVCLCVLITETFHRQAFAQRLGRVAFVQPDIPQEVKWDPAKGQGIVNVLQRLTLQTWSSGPDLILWPEAVTPWAVKGDPGTQKFVEGLSRRAQAPILLGSVGEIPSPAQRPGAAPATEWINGAFVVAPDFGLQNAYYAKRKLVPFGEYVPLRPLLGWLSKFVPIGDGDFVAGTDPSPLLLNLRSGLQAAGILICYEDTYPQVARRTVLAGADFLTVLTNNGWFGEGGAAYQHAAHSVLRAVETRRPVLRCGNAGWSGWIDEYGSIRFVFTNAEASVYFRGTKTMLIDRDSRWIGRKSYYVEHGDWFVLVALLLAGFGYAAIATSRAAPPEPVE